MARMVIEAGYAWMEVQVAWNMSEAANFGLNQAGNAISIQPFIGRWLILMASPSGESQQPQ